MKRSFAKDLLEMPEDKLVDKINNTFVRDDFKDMISSKIEETLHMGFDFIRDCKF